jgi:DNA polymerase-3 subunit gamma/tau
MIGTFSATNEITYQATIENLHILDYDYYFKMVSYLLEENISEVLLTFDEILGNGFDGHQFVVGLLEHIRNLMVCKDPATVKLLTVSENIKKRYAEQAEKAPLSFLMSALNIANQCDIQYKSSKNQRLHVELMLMKLAHVNAAVNLVQFSNAESPLKKKVM